MSKPKELIIREIFEDYVEYYIDNTHIITANHDEDGWNSMGRIDSALKQMAEICGLKIRYYEDPNVE